MLFAAMLNAIVPLEIVIGTPIWSECLFRTSVPRRPSVFALSRRSEFFCAQVVRSHFLRHICDTACVTTQA